MARQAGPFFFIGTIGDVIFYKVGEHYFTRMKGSYNTKALQKPGARPLMQLKQQEFGRASKLASEVYKTVPPKERNKALFNALTKQARQLLQAGEAPEAIVEALLNKVVPVATPVLPVVQEHLPKETCQKRPNKQGKIRLSRWQISKKGKLVKEVKHPSVPASLVTEPYSILPTKGGCMPCIYTGLKYLQKE